MKRGTNVKVPSSNVSSDENSCTFSPDKGSSQTGMGRMENPFQNLHPKIYYRHKNAEPKRTITYNRKEIKMDLKSTPLMSVYLKTDHSTKHSSLFDDCSAEKATRRGQHDNFAKGLLNKETYSRDQDTVANQNQRNTSLPEDSDNGEKLALPLIVLPSAAKDNRQLMTGFVPSGKSNKVFFPSIKEVPSFIPIAHAEEKRKGKRWHKRIRVLQTESRIGKLGASESWLDSSATEDTANQIIQRKSLNLSRTIPDIFSSRTLMTSQTQSVWKYRHDDHTTDKDYMIVKAKIHRSTSFL